MGYIAINQDVMTKYGAFFKELHEQTNSTRHRKIKMAELVKKHGIDRFVVPRAMELRILDKIGSTRDSRYKWIGQYPDPILVRRVLDTSNETFESRSYVSKPKVSNPPVINTPKHHTEKTKIEVKPVYSTRSDDAIDIINRLREEGKTYDEIGPLFGVSGSAINKKVLAMLHLILRRLLTIEMLLLK